MSDRRVALTIEPSSGSPDGRFPVRLRDARGRVVSGSCSVTEDRMTELLKYSAWLLDQAVTASERRSRLVEIGRTLLETLSSPVRTRLLAAFHDADQRGAQLVVQLATPAELTPLPWEYLYLEPAHGAADFAFRHHHLVRVLPQSPPQRALEVPSSLRVLAMVGHADGLDVQKERAKMRSSLGSLVSSGEVVVEWVEGRSWQDLTDRIRFGEPPHIVHLVAHGEYHSEFDQGVVYFETTDGPPMPVPARELSTVLRGRPSIRLVVLNGCETGSGNVEDPYSSIAGALTGHGIPAVVAMQYEITDDAAIILAETLYRTLAHKHTIAASVTNARQDIATTMPHSLEWGVPVLYTSDPDRALFEYTRAPRQFAPNAVKTLRMRQDVNAVTFSLDSDQLLLGCDGRTPALFTVGSWEARSPTRKRATSVYGVAFSPGGDWYATACLDERVEIWRVGDDLPAGSIAHPDWVGDVAISPGGLLCTVGGDEVVRGFQVEWHDRRARITPAGRWRHDRPVRAVTFSPTGDEFATACDDGFARVFPVDGEESRIALPHDEAVLGVAFSPTGAELATACRDRRARIFDATNGARNARFRHTGWVTDVEFSPDHKRLATASTDGTVTVWSLERHTADFTIRHRDTVRRVAFSPDGRWIATASYDRTCQIWQFDRFADDAGRPADDGAPP